MADVPVAQETYRLGWHDPIEYVFATEKGLDEGVIREISAQKEESAEILQRRLTAFRVFRQLPVPTWGGAGRLADIDFGDIRYYVRPTRVQVRDWNQVPVTIKTTFDRLAIPQAEERFLGGVSAQYDSEVVYHRNRLELDRLGVVFTDMDTAVREHWDLVRRHLGTVVPFDDNKFAALNSAVWSGGSFLYVPPARARGEAPAGLLPHQRRENGPVRTHPGRSRRRRLRSLHRRLLRRPVGVNVSPCRRDRGGGGTWGALPYHRPAELVKERL